MNYPLLAGLVGAAAVMMGHGPAYAGFALDPRLVQYSPYYYGCGPNCQERHREEAWRRHHEWELEHRGYVPPPPPNYYPAPPPRFPTLPPPPPLPSTPPLPSPPRY